MHSILNDLAISVRNYLEMILQEGKNENWWETRVVSRLTYQQQRVVAEKSIQSLSGLDVAGLLRVLDQNWPEINASEYRLPFEARNWLKEAQNIRNRWAHLPAEGLLAEDTYRDFDTVSRLMSALGADDAVVSRVKADRDQVLKIDQPALIITENQNANVDETQNTITKGSVVQLKARPDTTGAVIDVLTGGKEPRYQVFHDDAISIYYASQIEIKETTAERATINPLKLHAALTAMQLRHPSSDHLYSLFSSRINFVPYQFRPVIKLINSDRPRLLIADEVGVGKTIEAGLILKELQSRRNIQSVLVICPKPLVVERKWVEELKRFDEEFFHLSSANLRYCINETDLDGIWPQRYNRSILPYSLLDESLLMGKDKRNKKQKGLIELDSPPTFDLVIVDEAHHIRNTNTWAYRNVRYFCDNAEAVLLLSATPIQLGDNDLYTLLHLLRPDILPSLRDFEQMAAPNPYINNAIEYVRASKEGWSEAAHLEIEKAISTPWGRDVLTTDNCLQEARDLLGSAPDSDGERIKLIAILEALYTFSPLINRTRRRDIGNFTIRKPETVTVDFTTDQTILHEKLIDLIGRMLTWRHGDQNLQFMMTTLRRQVASCVFGLAPLLSDMLKRHLSQLQPSEMSDVDVSEEIDEVLSEFRTDIESLVAHAQTIEGPDPKFDALLKVIQDKQFMPNNKLLLFSTFRHTLAYLNERLSHYSIRIGLIHGDIRDDERRELRHRFSLDNGDPQALDVLLSSEVGCEGLDFQFCNGLVNYDLPWNPMRIEQRIGRIDRYGQQSETIAIYNFITPGTVDAEIYERCLLRIGVFRQALGGSEEILGRLTRDINTIAENMKLTDEERTNRLQQLADNEIRLVQEQSQLEEEESKLFGLAIPKLDEELLKQTSSFWLTPTMLANLVAQYLESLGATNLTASFGKKSIVNLKLAQELRDRLIIDFNTLKLTGAVSQHWVRWLKGNEPYLAVTFEPSTASSRRDITFITPTHPLARQAAQSIEPTAPLISNLHITNANNVPSGRYPYAIYRWNKIGLKEDFTFQPVCEDERVSTQILSFLQTVTPAEIDRNEITTEEEQRLESHHYQLWINHRAKHIEQITQATQARLASLDTTHAARIAQLEEQHDSVTDKRIRRMKESQIESAHRDYKARASQLKVAPEQADLIAEAVVFGVLIVEK